jgi:hypothetical protein
MHLSPSVSTAVTRISWLLPRSDGLIPLTARVPRQGLAADAGAWVEGGGMRLSRWVGRRKTIGKVINE